jgi:WD40 repeat protein
VYCCEPGLSEGGGVANVAFNYDGNLAALACKDRQVRVLDLRAGSVSLSTPSGSLGRNLRSEW